MTTKALSQLPKEVGQHAGISWSDPPKGWVNMQESPCATIAQTLKGAGQHAGMVGQLKQEWWVNMVRNLHSY